jgi:hypothetical protein
MHLKLQLELRLTAKAAPSTNKTKQKGEMGGEGAEPGSPGGSLRRVRLRSAPLRAALHTHQTQTPDTDTSRALQGPRGALKKKMSKATYICQIGAK